jgi:hypothetical protein
MTKPLFGHVLQGVALQLYFIGCTRPFVSGCGSSLLLEQFFRFDIRRSSWLLAKILTNASSWAPVARINALVELLLLLNPAYEAARLLSASEVCHENSGDRQGE